MWFSSGSGVWPRSVFLVYDFDIENIHKYKNTKSKNETNTNRFDMQVDKEEEKNTEIQKIQNTKYKNETNKNTGELT